MCGWWQSSRHFVHVTSRHFANLRIHSSLCCPSIDSFPCDLSVCLSVIKFQRMLSSCRPLALASFNNFFLLLLLTMDHGGGFRPPSNQHDTSIPIQRSTFMSTHHLASHTIVPIFLLLRGVQGSHAAQREVRRQTSQSQICRRNEWEHQRSNRKVALLRPHLNLCIRNNASDL